MSGVVIKKRIQPAMNSIGSGGTKGRISFMNLNNKNCPYCGEKLNLVSPTKNELPLRMAVSANGVEFCVKPAFRLCSYSHKAHSLSKNYIESQKSFFEKSKIDIYQGTLFARGNARFRCITTKYTDTQIRKGGLHLYKEYLTFCCANCHNTLAVNCNPWRTFAIVAWILPLIVCCEVVFFFCFL